MTIYIYIYYIYIYYIYNMYVFFSARADPPKALDPKLLPRRVPSSGQAAGRKKSCRPREGLRQLLVWFGRPRAMDFRALLVWICAPFFRVAIVLVWVLRRKSRGNRDKAPGSAVESKRKSWACCCGLREGFQEGSFIGLCF